MWNDDPYIDRTMRKVVFKREGVVDIFVWAENLEIAMKIGGSRGYEVEEDPSLDPDKVYFDGVIARDGVWYWWEDIDNKLWVDNKGNPLWPTDTPGMSSPEEMMKIREQHGQLRLPFKTKKAPAIEVPSATKEDFEIDFSIFGGK